MNNVVNFSQLKRKEIRKQIGVGENAILIYNPNNEQKKEIRNLVTDNVTDNKVNISGKDTLLKLVPMLTNIKLDLDEKKDKELIEEILTDPSEELEEVVKELTRIVFNVLHGLMNDLDDFNKFPVEIRESIIEETNKEEEINNKKQKEIKELENKLKALKEDDTNATI